MVSVVRFTVNYFTEQFFFFARFYSQGLAAPGQLSGWGGLWSLKTRDQKAESPYRCLPAAIFPSPACHFTCIVWAEFYTHFICTRGSQINYKREPSSKQLSGHLFCSLRSHLLSLTLNHTCLRKHIVLHFKHCIFPNGLMRWNYISFFCDSFGTLLGKFVCRWSYLACSVGVYVHTSAFASKCAMPHPSLTGNTCWYLGSSRAVFFFFSYLNTD